MPNIVHLLTALSIIQSSTLELKLSVGDSLVMSGPIEFLVEYENRGASSFYLLEPLGIIQGTFWLEFVGDKGSVYIRSAVPDVDAEVYRDMIRMLKPGDAFRHKIVVNDDLRAGAPSIVFSAPGDYRARFIFFQRETVDSLMELFEDAKPCLPQRFHMAKGLFFSSWATLTIRDINIEMKIEKFEQLNLLLSSESSWLEIADSLTFFEHVRFAPANNLVVGLLAELGCELRPFTGEAIRVVRNHGTAEGQEVLSKLLICPQRELVAAARDALLRWPVPGELSGL